MRHEMTFSTHHCQQRQQERAIADYAVEFAVRYGTRCRVSNVFAYYLRWRDMPVWMPTDQARRLHATVVIVGHDGALITTYRDKKYLHDWKRRPRHTHAA